MSCKQLKVSLCPLSSLGSRAQQDAAPAQDHTAREDQDSGLSPGVTPRPHHGTLGSVMARGFLWSGKGLRMGKEVVGQESGGVSWLWVPERTGDPGRSRAGIG